MTALFQLANGASLRICEFRECAAHSLDRFESETFRIFGTAGSFSRNEWTENHRSRNTPAVRPFETKVLTPQEMFTPFPDEVDKLFRKVLFADMSEVDQQNADFVPTGHGGSHPYLVHEFCSAIAEDREPAIGIDQATHYMAMGVAATKSAQRDGEIVPVTE